MKKYITYIGILAIGLVLGWFIFGETSSGEKAVLHHGEEKSGKIWTCSMHPQIKVPKFGKCPICGMDLTPMKKESDTTEEVHQFKLTKNAIALANIQTSIVGNNTVEKKILKVSGKISINENKTATQSAHFNGRIEKLYVHSLGESVEKGQAIAKIYSPELVAAQQELITAYTIRESQPELYRAVRNKFKNWEINDTQLKKIETSKKIITQFTIYSPISGIVSDISVKEGSHITNGFPIFKIANLTSVWANFDVYENQIKEFKKGQAIQISNNAYPDKKYRATISFIDPILNTKTRTVTIRAILPNNNKEWKPGMFIQGIVPVASLEKNKIIIPASAVLWTGKRAVVYIKTNPDTPVFAMREIELGQVINKNYEVIKGLKNGDEIVTNGTFTIDATAQLQGRKSMMDTKK